MIDLETFAERKSLCFLRQLWPSIYLEPEEPLFPGVFVPHSWKEEAEPPQLERWVKNVVAGSNQAQESFGAYGDPNVWSKYNSLVSVLQGDFYQHCNNNSSLPEGLMGLVLLVLIDLGWRPAFQSSSAAKDLVCARALKRRFIRESHD